MDFRSVEIWVDKVALGVFNECQIGNYQVIRGERGIRCFDFFKNEVVRNSDDWFRVMTFFEQKMSKWMRDNNIKPKGKFKTTWR